MSPFNEIPTQDITKLDQTIVSQTESEVTTSPESEANIEVRIQILRDLAALNYQYKDAVEQDADVVDILIEQRRLLKESVIDAPVLRALTAAEGKEYTQVIAYLVDRTGDDLEISDDAKDVLADSFILTTDELLDADNINWIRRSINATANIPKNDWKSRALIADSKWIAERTLETNQPMLHEAILKKLNREKATDAIHSNTESEPEIARVFWHRAENLLTDVANVPKLKNLYLQTAKEVLINRQNVENSLSFSLVFINYAEVIPEEVFDEVYAKALSTVDPETEIGKKVVRMLLKSAINALPDNSTTNLAEITINTFNGSENIKNIISVAGLILGNQEAFIQSRADLQKIGLEITDDLISAWRQSSTENELFEDVERALTCMKSLEVERPGSVSVLQQEFGIEDFMRYSPEMLIDLYDNRDDQSMPYGIVIYPKADHNGAFTSNHETLESFYEQLKGHYRLRIFEAGSRVGVAKALIKTKQRYAQKGGGKISFALIGGHGSPGGIQFGNGSDRADLQISDLAGHGGNRAGGEFFESDPTIILESCSTGEIGGIGQKMSEILSAHVIAPDVPTAFKNIQVEYDENDKPSFEITFSSGKGMVYKEGEHQEQID